MQHGQGEEQFGNHLGRQRVLFVIEPTVISVSEVIKLTCTCSVYSEVFLNASVTK